MSLPLLPARQVGRLGLSSRRQAISAHANNLIQNHHQPPNLHCCIPLRGFSSLLSPRDGTRSPGVPFAGSKPNRSLFPPQTIPSFSLIQARITPKEPSQSAFLFQQIRWKSKKTSPSKQNLDEDIPLDQLQPTSWVGKTLQRLEADQRAKYELEKRQRKWHEKYAERAQIIPEEEADKATPSIRRLIPSFLVTVAVVGACYIFSLNYTPAPANKKWMPEFSTSFTTVLPIIVANVAATLLWRLPWAWRAMNKYFLMITMKPNVVALVGSMFSHQSFFHLFMNMFVLWAFAPTLVDQIGRGNFLGLYFSGGMIAGFGSLAFSTATGMMWNTALGASGAISAILASFCMINPEQNLVIVFLPFLPMTAKTLLAGLFVFESAGLLGMMRSLRFDHAAHLSGLAWGSMCGWWYVKSKEERQKMIREGRWFPKR